MGNKLTFGNPPTTRVSEIVSWEARQERCTSRRKPDDFVFFSIVGLIDTPNERRTYYNGGLSWEAAQMSIDKQEAQANQYKIENVRTPTRWLAAARMTQYLQYFIVARDR
jgi:hypothetical protein